MVKQSVLTELLSTSSFLISSATFALLLLMYVCRVLREHRQRGVRARPRHALRQERERKLEQLQVVCFALHEAKVLPENADQRSGHPPYMRHWSGADTPTDISSPLSTPAALPVRARPHFCERRSSWIRSAMTRRRARLDRMRSCSSSAPPLRTTSPLLPPATAAFSRAHAQSRAQLKATSRSQRHRKRRTYLRPRPRWRRLLQRRLFWSGSEMSSSS